MIRRMFLTGLTVLLSVQACNADIVIDGYTDATNDRFSNSASFNAGSYDLSGVGQNDVGRWTTAISRNVIISAWHYRPANGSTVYFYPDNNPDQAPITRTVSRGVKVPNTDLYLGMLNTYLPTSIAHYSYATEALSGRSGSTFPSQAGSMQAMNTLMFGRSPFRQSTPNDNRFVYNDQAVGRNLVEGYLENTRLLRNFDADAIIMWHDSQGDSDYVDFEAQYRGGDSGGPTFVDYNGELMLLGTNAFLLGNGSGGYSASGINYTGNQAAYISGFITANSIPEPSGFIWIACLGLLLRPSKRRKQISL